MVSCRYHKLPAEVEYSFAKGGPKPYCSETIFEGSCGRPVQSDLGCEGPRSRGEEPRPSGKVSKMVLSGEGGLCVHDIQIVGLEAAI